MATMLAVRRGTHAARQWWSLWLPCGASLAFSLVFIARTAFRVGGTLYFTLFDDAMIAMQYARNLAQGHGAVWVAGQPPVEGYTDPLWMLGMAALHLLPVPEAQVSLLVMLAGAALLVADLLVVRALALALAPDRPAVPFLAAWLTAFAYPLLYWTLRGMEVGLAALLITAMALVGVRLAERYAARRLAALAAVAALALATRMDLLVPALVVAGYVVSSVAPGRRRRCALALGGTLAAALGAQTAARLWYYGVPLPNTYFLKMTGVAPLTRVAVGLAWLLHLVAVSLWPALALIGAYALLRRGRLERGVWLLVALVLGQCAYSAYVGGDAWEWLGYANRYIAPALPALSLLTALAIDGLVARLPRRAGAAGARAAAVGLGLAVWLLVNGQAFGGLLASGVAIADQDAAMARYGLLLRETTAPDAVIAVAWAGAPTYFSHRAAVDLYGKSDRRVATGPPQPIAFKPGHTKWDYAYSIGALRPDLVANLGPVTPADLAALAAWGYRPLAPTVYVRADTTAVDRAALARGLATLPPWLTAPAPFAAVDRAQRAPALFPLP